MDIPVLLIIFNRPEITRRTFEVIRKIKPTQLYIAADGPRLGHPTDLQRCEATRLVVQNIDWTCNVQTLFRNENRGCGYAPAEAISWFFGQVEEGIILEDDCLPDESFFLFCAELLERYRQNKKVSIISGTNPLGAWRLSGHSYMFSALGGTWGWASWRRAWAGFDYTASAWLTDEGKQRVAETLKRRTFYNHFANEFDTYFSSIRSDVWDYQWYFTRLYNGSCGIVPSVNLITNIGFDGDGTHTFQESRTLTLESYTLQRPLTHPPLKVNHFFDWYLFDRCINPAKRSLIKKVILKIIKLLLERL